ncbi:TolC family protein [Marinifilum sp. D714]|uniref:TolC family protein n=1 Tax=Marinifilum sp. D714 TaxID=2937523 RepID=UPI0027C59598|nr:TolC family protein [Marinifilum sp. D714]MDQ2177154.1 TolC family protein [Marinifilum sp. D714]
MNKIVFVIMISILSLSAKAQNTVQDVLSAIEKNNPVLKANEQFFEAQNLGFKAQTNLDNPELEWEKSFSSDEGKPYEILVSQSFDFPTSYLYKNQLKKAQIANTENYKAKSRQDILLEAKLLCIKLIYYNKQKAELQSRLTNAERLNDLFQKRLEEGDATILEANKIKMLRLNTANQLKMIESKVSNLTDDLIKLNGGKQIDLNLLEYPLMSIDQGMKELLTQSLNADPQLKLLSTKEEISAKETSLVKTNSLPKFSIGYRYLNSDIMKQANGIKLGLSIPLWENKNKVKRARLLEQFNREEYLIGKMELENKFLKLFRNFLNLEKSMKEYKGVFTEKHYDTLLQKALTLGEISSIEYLTENIYYYESVDTYLEIEHEYYKTMSELLKFRL